MVALPLCRLLSLCCCCSRSAAPALPGTEKEFLRASRFALGDLHWMDDAPPPAAPPNRAARRAMIRAAARAGRRPTLRARRGDDDSARRAAAAARRDDAARAPPPRQTLLAEHVASTAELNDLFDALAAYRAFTAAVAHATTGGQTPRRSHSRARGRATPLRASSTNAVCAAAAPR